MHANLEALEACVDAAQQYDLVFNLGDIVGYGASPNEVTERSRALGKIFVRGNHDKACTRLESIEGFNPVAALAAMWTNKRLTAENIEFLNALHKGPFSPREGLQCVHGSARDEDQHVVVAREAYPLLEETKARLTFFA